MLDRRPLLVLLLATAAIHPLVAVAGGTDSCVQGTRPAATLLFPYFEVDPSAAASRTTSISIGNAVDEPVLAQVVVWTNCGIPVLDFTLYLAADAIQSLDLRKVIVGGQIPVTGPGGGAHPFPGCSDPLSIPVLDAADLERLRTRLSGQPAPDDGLCYAQPDATSPWISGYVTADVLNDCSETLRTPLDEGYFASGGQGLASNLNALWGDFYLIDASGHAAQGFEAVSVIADAALFTEPRPSFYFSGDGDDRLPLSSRYRTRFLNGGGFDGGTEIILWAQHRAPFFFGGPREPPCEAGCYSAIGLRAFARARDERGVELGTQSFFPKRFPIKLRVGGEDLPVDGAFGSFDFGFDGICGICSPPYAGPIQGWVMPLHSAAGRFGVGLSAARLNDLCNP